jgi:predicted secreted protein
MPSQLAVRVIAAAVFLGACPLASVPQARADQRSPAAAPEFPQLKLSANAAREVAQDRVAVTLFTTQESPTPGPAQAQVNARLAPVIDKLRSRKDVQVESAGYRSDPVWKDSRIVAWRARGAIRITGAPSEDFNKLVGELASSLNVEAVSHFLSRETRIAIEQELIGEAVSAFRAKAQATAQALGYRSWNVRSVTIGQVAPEGPEPGPRVMLSRAAAAEAAPMPIAEGRTEVTVSVNGVVVLER